MRKGWREAALGEIADVTMGQSPPGISYNTEGNGLPFMQGSAEFGEHFPEPVKWCTSPARVAEFGDVLLSVRAPVGDTNTANQRIAIGRGLATLRGGKHASTEFLRLLIQLNRSELIANSGSGMFASITGKNLRNLKVLLPPMVEQKRIVDLVSSVDTYIAALEQQAYTARTARNAVLHELLSTDGDDWTQTTLGEIGLTGMFADGDWVESKDQDPEGEFRLLQLADVGDGVFLDKSNRWMNSEQFSRLRCTPLRPRDILIARMPDPIARACVLPSGLMSCATVVDVAILRCGEGYEPEFVALVINDSVFRAKAQSLLTGTTRQRISRSNLAEIVFMVPSIAEQKRIVATVSSMDEVIQSTEHSAAKAATLRSGLLSDLLSGELEIPSSYDRFLRAAERFSYA